MGTLRADDLLRTLREGDHDAFVRYYRLFRVPVYHFARRLLRDDAAAAGATRDALTAAFRRAILDEDPDDLETLTFRCALEVCEGLPAPATPESESAGAPGVHVSSGDPDEGTTRRRVEAALGSLEPRQRAALLLHDLQGMDAARSAEVLGLGAEAAGALLFRAREEFREALHARPGYGDGGRCRQAEEALAGAVGLGMDEDGLARLRRHAGYCRSCRGTMKGWTTASVGLAAVLTPPPLPEVLAAAPVFGDLDGPAPAAGRRSLGALLPLLLARTGRALRGRAAAWVVAAACLALAAGLVVHGLGLRPLVLMQSVGPAIRLIVVSPGDGSEPAAARGAGRESTTTTSPAIGISGDGQAGPAAAGPAGPELPGAAVDDPASPGGPATAGGPPSDERETTPVAEEPGGAASSSAEGRADGRDKDAKADDKAAKADAKADDKAARASDKASDKAGKPEGKAAKAGGKKRDGDTGKQKDRDSGKKKDGDSGKKKDRDSGKKRDGGKKAG